MKLTKEILSVAVAALAGVALSKETLVAEYIIPNTTAALAQGWDYPGKIFDGYNTETKKGFTFTIQPSKINGYGNYYLSVLSNQSYVAFGQWLKPEENANTSLPSTYTRSIALYPKYPRRYIYLYHIDDIGQNVRTTMYDLPQFFGKAMTPAYLESWVVGQNGSTQKGIDVSSTDYYDGKTPAPYVQCIHTDYVYTVTFDSGTVHPGSMPSQSVTNSAALAACTFTCAGCTFTGWATSEGGSAIYKDGATIEPEDDMTLYAAWQPIKYSIQFNGNGGTGSQSPISSIGYHDTVPVPGCAFSLAGYAFSGWATNQNGKVVFREGEEVSELTPVNNKVVILYACWNPLAKIPVTFDAVPGTVVGENPREYTPGVAYGSFPTAARAGYALNYWKDASGTRMYVESLVPGEAHTLYAVWKGNAYKVWFNDDKDETMGSQSFTYGEAQALKSVSQFGFPERGYDFVGWATNATERVPVYSDAAVVSNLTTQSETDLYAVLTASPSFIRFDPVTNAATGTMSVQTCLCHTEMPLTACGYARPGYAFSGWATEPGGKMRYKDGATYEADNAMAHKTNTLYAVWRANSYEVTFDANGGPYDPDPLTKTYTYDTPYGTLATVTNDEGTAFAGWYTEKLGGEQIVTNATVAIISNSTFYAHWISAPFALTFDAQGGGFTNGLATLTVVDRYIDGQPYGEFPLVTNAAGRVFAGWWTSQDLSVRVQQVATDTASLACKTLYARWKTVLPAQAVAVVFDANGGTGGDTFNRDVGTAVGSLPPDPSRTGHRFVGWFGTREGGERITPDSVILCATNFYARWSDEAIEAVLGRFDGLAFQTDADNGWFEETDEASKCGGNPTMRSGAIDKSATSTLTAYLTLGGGSLSFDWALWSRVSHPLYWRMNNATERSLVCASGKYAPRVDEHVQQAVSAHVSKLDWVYDKDTQSAQFSDRGWLANLSWMPNVILPPIWDWATNSVRTNLTFETGGMKAWTMAAANEGIRSGADLGDSAYGWVRTTAKGSGTLTFRWRTDCENGYADEQGRWQWTDRLEFRVDGQVVRAIGGETAWSEFVTNVTAAADVPHVFEWRYVKDDDASQGADAAWLDGVTWVASKPTHPEPTSADRRDIASVTMTGGTLRLAFDDADPSFDYQLRGTNELLVPMPWPVMWTTNGTGTLVIEPPRSAEPQMFYYLQVIQKP